MPPALPEDDASGSASEPEEIPYRSKGKERASDENEPEAEDGSDDENEETEEEYIVEKITGFQYGDDGTLHLQVKWLGYEKKSDRTWEPEEHLDGASEALQDYFESIGGRPQPGDDPKSKKGKRKQSVAASPAETKTGSGRGRKKMKVENGDVEDDAGHKGKKESKWMPPKGTWEHDVMNIDCIEEDVDEATGDKKRVGFVMWNNGKKSKHSLGILNSKCPQKLLAYYEQHLVFRTSSSKTSANGANQASGSPEAGDAEVKDDE
ncbi:MAG: hypothetical protein M1821_003973 [Bathelium mastoideum]|nr:MAG: hypothetical protein M1821_003973 [Bathelium mastoideum]KAI9691047.1 MAG: hypothetical protein M1822_008667 [Bathelium mastoideum]